MGNAFTATRHQACVQALDLPPKAFADSLRRVPVEYGLPHHLLSHAEFFAETLLES